MKSRNRPHRTQPDATGKSATPGAADFPPSDPEAIAGSPPGTTAGQNTSPVPDPDSTAQEQLTHGERARRDAESEQVDTDRYNTSGNDNDPPKTASD